MNMNPGKPIKNNRNDRREKSPEKIDQNDNEEDRVSLDVCSNVIPFLILRKGREKEL